LCIFATRYLHEYEIAEDIVSDFFCKIHENKIELKVNSSIKSYLYKSIRNQCINYLNFSNTKLEKIDIEIAKHTIPSNFEDDFKMFESKSTINIENYLSKLPKQTRLIFEMSKFDHLKYKEIADELELSVNTIETQMSRALKKLRSLYFKR
jgi:RNA polymerase sigma-70 factor (ECF subfamily)